MLKTYLIIYFCCLQRSHGADANGAAAAARPPPPLPGVHAGRGEQQQPGRPGREGARPLAAARPLPPALPALAAAAAPAAPPPAALSRGTVQPLSAAAQEIAAHGASPLSVQPKLP